MNGVERQNSSSIQMLNDSQSKSKESAVYDCCYPRKQESPKFDPRIKTPQEWKKSFDSKINYEAGTYNIIVNKYRVRKVNWNNGCGM